MTFAPEEPLSPTGYGSRHVLAWMGFWSFAVNHAMRFNISIAIVAMAKSFNTAQKGSHLDGCAEVADRKISESFGGDFGWNEAEQGLILGSFFWGFTLTQLPGGIISDKFGGKWVVGISLLITAFLTILIPFASYMGMYYLIVVRILQGLAEGVTTPAIQVLLAKWLPPNERSRLATITYSGFAAGTAFSMISSGYIIEAYGWPFVFYATGAATMVWFIFWSFLVYESPLDHPRISKEECIYILEALGENVQKRGSVPTPWRKILTSKPVWAIFIAQIAYMWGISTLQMLLPSYMSTVLNFELKLNSWLSATPHLCMWFFGLFGPYLADIVLELNWTSVIFMRKMCNSVSLFGASLAFVVAIFAGCNWLVAVISLNLALGFLGIAFGGFIVNSIDIAPQHCGVIQGLVNSISNLCGFGAPYIAGLLASSDPSWNSVFWAAAAVLLVGNTVFVIFASGRVAEWNGPMHGESVEEFDSVSMSSYYQQENFSVPPYITDQKMPSPNLSYRNASMPPVPHVPVLTVVDLSQPPQHAVSDKEKAQLEGLSMPKLQFGHNLSIPDVSNTQRLSIPELSRHQRLSVPEQSQPHRLSAPQLSQTQYLSTPSQPRRRLSGISAAIYLG